MTLAQCRVEALQSIPMQDYSDVSPIECNGAYSLESRYRIEALVSHLLMVSTWELACMLPYAVCAVLLVFWDKAIFFAKTELDYSIGIKIGGYQASQFFSLLVVSSFI